MKLLLSRNLMLLAFALVASGIISGCSESKVDTATETPEKATIPQLMDRAESLGSVEEQVNVAQKYDKAVAQVNKNEADASAWLDLAEIFVNEARITGEHPYYYPAALMAVEKALAIPKIPKDEQFRGLYTKALIQLSLHNFRAGLETGKKAVAINPHNAGIYGVLVDAHVELGEYTQAVEMSDKMVSIRPDLRSYSRISYLREIHGDIDGAIDAMDMAVKAGYPGFEQSTWCRLVLGELYKKYKKDYTAAEAQYQQALLERPDYPFAIAAIAEIQFEKGEVEAAKESIDKAIALIPEVGFYGTLADIHLHNGNTEKANELADEMITMMQEDAESGHNMDLEFARLYLNRKSNPDKALEYAMKEYAARPANIDVNKVLAEIYVEMEDWDNAQSHIEKAMATQTKDPETLALGAIIAKKG